MRPGLFVALLVVTAGSALHPQQPLLKEWIDADTGHRVVRLIDDAGGSTLYFCGGRLRLIALIDQGAVTWASPPSSWAAIRDPRPAFRPRAAAAVRHRPPSLDDDLAAWDPGW